MAVFNEPTKWAQALGATANADVIPDEAGAMDVDISKIFPAVFSVPLSQGGKAIPRRTLNGILKLLGDWLFYYQNGGVPSYNADFDYAVGREVLYNDKVWRCLKQNGADDPQTPAEGEYWTECLVMGSVLDNIYPVGSIYISVNNTSPSTLFGGEWEQIQEKFLLSAGDTHIAGTTGGEFTHTLTIDEMPAHNHTATIANSGNHNHDAYSDGAGGHTHTVSDLSHNDGTYVVTGGASPIGVKVGENWSTRTTSQAANHTHGIHLEDSGTHSHSTTISNTGSGVAMNITPPYLSVYMWQRTS